MLVPGMIVYLFLLLSSLSTINGFADWMTKDFCSRKLLVGTVIMNNKAVASEDRRVRIFRGTKELRSGDVYTPGEKLTVSISEAKNQYVYEVSDGGAKFERGGCDGIRVADKPKATLVMPPKGTKALPGFDIIVSWALGHEEVLISPAFRLESAESKEQNASSGNSKLSKKVEDSRDEGEEGEEESYTDVHHRAHLDGEEVPKHHSSDNDLTRRRPHLEEELEEGLEEGLEVHEEGEERGEGDKGKEGLHARTRTGDRPTAAHEQEDRGRAAGKEPPRLPAKEPQGAHELEELHTLAEHIHHLEPREKHVPLSTVFSRERDLYFHEKAESGHHRGAKADSGGSRGGSRGKSGVREKEGKVELKEGVKEGVRKEVKEEVKMEVRKEVKEVVSEVVKDELKEVEKEEVKEVKKEEVKEVEKEEVKGRRYEVRERIFDNIEKDSHQWDGESVRQVRGEGEERGEGGERGEGEEGGEGGEKGRRDRHPGRLHSEEEHQQQPEGGRPVAHYDERQKGDKGDKGDKGEPSIHEDRHHQEEKEKEEGKGVREQGEGEEEQQEHHHAPSRLSEIEPDHHPIDHHHRDFFAPVANIRDRLQGSFKAHHEAVERMTKHAFEGFGGGFKTDPKADPDPIREHASGPSQETGIDSPLAESHGEVLGSQEPGPPRGERPARADRSAEEGSHGENLPREESPDEVSPHQETLEEHQRTDQFHHKFGVKNVAIEHHHKYHVGKVEEGSHDALQQGHSRSQDAARAMSALGAKAAATMNKLRGRGGGDSHSGSGRGRVWEMFAIALAAGVLLFSSRVYANRHRWKKYLLARGGYDLDK